MRTPEPAGERVTNPLSQLPPRRPGSVRRIASLAIEPEGEWDDGAVIEAVARDSVCGPDGGTVTILDTASVTAATDASFRLATAGGDIPPAVAAALAGRTLASGFRKELARLAGLGLDPDSLLAALLDDLPTVQLISGYARLMERGPSLTADGRTSAPMLNVCRGWAADSTANRLAASGQSVITGTPSAPLLGGAATVLDEAPLRPRSMRRRRVLDLVPIRQELEVFQYFRDSHVDASGREGALHEYVMTARLSAGDLVVRSLSVEPRTLPFPECPLAAPNAQSLVGRRAHDVESSVRSTLGGTMGCTHLNDVLRFLRFAGHLADAARRAADEGF